MNPLILEAIEVTTKLNTMYYDQTGNEINIPFGVNIACNDWIEYVSIEFMHQTIWNSENDYRDYIDEEKDIQESLYNHIVKEIKIIKSNLAKVKFK